MSVTDSYLQFRRPARNCLVCGTDLAALDRHPSGLKLGSETEQAIREDICPECWKRLGSRDYFCTWVTRRYQEGPSPEERKLAKAERNEALWALFNALYALKSDELSAQLFLVAHLLMKYRVLQYRGARPDGELEFWHQPTQESYLVPDMPLDAVSFVEVKDAVEKRLHEFAPRAGDEGDGVTPA